MGINERRNREKVELRKKILESAFALINRDGHHKLTIRKLAGEIEYSPRTVYLYYADRDEILRAVVEYGFSFTLNKLRANEFYKDLSPEEHMKTAIENHVKMAFGNPNYYRTVVHVIQDKGTAPGPSQKEVERYISESIAAHCRNEGADRDFTTFFLTSSLRGNTIELLNRQLNAGNEDIDEIIKQLVGFYSRLILRST